MRFIVEVPTYAVVEVNASDVELAISYAESLVKAGKYDRLELLPEDSDDREPDVYICRGGKLTMVTPDGTFIMPDDDCPLAM